MKEAVTDVNPPPGMLPVGEALARILALLEPLPTEEVPVEDALGRALRDGIRAQRTLPPWNNASMDGYAVRAGDAQAPGAVLRVVQTLHAGEASGRPLLPGECARIMTGAPLPPGADAVVMQERTSPAGDGAIRLEVAGPPGQHVRLRGEEVTAGAPLLAPGAVLGLPEAGLLWAQGLLRVEVPRRPRVALLSTGDELCRPHEAPEGRIVDTNLPVLAAAVRLNGGEVTRTAHARDLLSAVREELEAAAAAGDLVLTTAGVSVGERDLVRPALEAMGVTLDFWRVAMRPGKPLLIGKRGATTFLCLPGNPTSALVTFELFVRPALRRLLGHAEVRPPKVPGRLAADVAKDPGLAHFVRVRSDWRDGALWATPLASQGSGTLGSAAGATHLMHLPPEAASLRVGAPVELLPVSWRC